jgi:hypothetical protein
MATADPPRPRPHLYRSRFSLVSAKLYSHIWRIRRVIR